MSLEDTMRLKEEMMKPRQHPIERTLFYAQHKRTNGKFRCFFTLFFFMPHFIAVCERTRGRRRGACWTTDFQVGKRTQTSGPVHIHTHKPNLEIFIQIAAVCYIIFE